MHITLRFAISVQILFLDIFKNILRIKILLSTFAALLMRSCMVDLTVVMMISSVQIFQVETSFDKTILKSLYCRKKNIFATIYNCNNGAKH